MDLKDIPLELIPWIHSPVTNLRADMCLEKIKHRLNMDFPEDDELRTGLLEAFSKRIRIFCPHSEKDLNILYQEILALR